MVDRRKIGRNSKRRSANDERDVAKATGGRRHWANIGGPEDVEHPTLAIQVKGGKSVTTVIARGGMEGARQAAEGTDKLPALVTVDRSGTRTDRWISFPLDEFVNRYLRCTVCDQPPANHHEEGHEWAPSK